MPEKKYSTFDQARRRGPALRDALEACAMRMGIRRGLSDSDLVRATGESLGRMARATEDELRSMHRQDTDRVRPWTCPAPGCDFRTYGYAAAEIHDLSQAHVSAVHDEASPDPGWVNCSEVEPPEPGWYFFRHKTNGRIEAGHVDKTAGFSWISVNGARWGATSAERDQNSSRSSSLEFHPARLPDPPTD